MKRKPTQQTPADIFATVRTMGLALPDVEAATKYDGSPVTKIISSTRRFCRSPSSEATITRPVIVAKDWPGQLHLQGE